MIERDDKPYRSKTLLSAYRELLDRLNREKAKPDCDLDPEAVAGITDYLLDRIDAYRPSIGAGGAEKNPPENAQFATPENPRNNDEATGAR
ncbi:hypothetical protein [Rhodanobacter lindaniclasticus]|uniref:Uncharacterized protein n=1 Tax=Rhodanobacter lindaniclasticus TaxID=75310 RepID=A0A4S3KL25_9GAMM|nr:hypothetical protein [Rhodanobacter lindaniclasticus]THD09449.1 hypothetical protein B1991_02290 [Rhodanobacter lindaniclasticus]